MIIQKFPLCYMRMFLNKSLENKFFSERDLGFWLRWFRLKVLFANNRTVI